MEFFLDTADVDEIREIASWGILDGVTTNPSLIKKSGRDFKQVVAEIASICDGPISAEVTAMDTEGMVEQALELKNSDPHVDCQKDEWQRPEGGGGKNSIHLLEMPLINIVEDEQKEWRLRVQ